MRIASFLLPMFVFSFDHSLAQKKTEGFIVTISNDTIAGTFTQFKPKKQPSKIQVNINSTTSTFTPRDIKGFQVGSSLYETHTVSLTRYNTDLQNAIEGLEPDVDTPRTVFLKTLHRGRLTLYEYIDNLGKAHYFINNDTRMKEIYVHYYKLVFRGHPIVTPHLQFARALKTFMEDCLVLFPTIDLLEFKANDIIEVLKKYDMCNE